MTIRSILRKIKNILLPPIPPYVPPTKEEKIATYIQNGRVAWSEGYIEYKFNEIEKNINNKNLLDTIRENKLPTGYGYRIDERVVEYPWIMAHLQSNSGKLLDAGSTFNFDCIVSFPLIQQKELYIHTYYPESPNFNEKRISYIYGDLRELPYKDAFFDEIVSQSTIEHIDMDNSIYGYDIRHTDGERKSYEYLKAIEEMLRVLKNGGTLLLTFPYGKFENHGFFQQLDAEMLAHILLLLDNKGNSLLHFFRYTSEGWIGCSQEDCKDVVSFNPHTNRGKGEDGAAHCRSICCIKFKKH
jgi:SAM-dependent methyltransferase